MVARRKGTRLWFLTSVSTFQLSQLKTQDIVALGKSIDGFLSSDIGKLAQFAVFSAFPEMKIVKVAMPVLRKFIKRVSYDSGIYELSHDCREEHLPLKNTRPGHFFFSGVDEDYIIKVPFTNFTPVQLQFFLVDLKGIKISLPLSSMIFRASNDRLYQFTSDTEFGHGEVERRPHCHLLISHFPGLRNSHWKCTCTIGISKKVCSFELHHVVWIEDLILTLAGQFKL